MITLFTELALKFFFLYTPFFALSMFLAMTADKSVRDRRILACRVAFATIVISCVLLLFGRLIFSVFGITIDAFRIGAGALLFLTAIALMNSKTVAADGSGEDISVVPLAMPIIIGPASCGALMVTGAELHRVAEKMAAISALVAAVFAIWVILVLGTWIERHLGKRGISIMMRLTALILAALSAQMVMTGVSGFLS